MDIVFGSFWSETRLPSIRCGFPQSHQENAGIKPQIKSQSPSPITVPVHYLLSHNWRLSAIATYSVVKQTKNKFAE